MKKFILTAPILVFVAMFIGCASTPSVETLAKREDIEKEMVIIPGTSLEMMKTEVTQGLYKRIMEENPSHFQTDSKNYLDYFKKDFELPAGEDESMLPVECVNWFDAIYFCNKLSVDLGYKPVYSVNGSTDINEWDYLPNKAPRPFTKVVKYNQDGSPSVWMSEQFTVEKNDSANGFRLPTEDEWLYAAKAGQDYKFSGSNDADEVCWHDGNSESRTHIVAQKKPNDYGLYDMTGNVYEWLWNEADNGINGYRKIIGGAWCFYDWACAFDDEKNFILNQGDSQRSRETGFRIVRTVSSKEK